MAQKVDCVVKVDRHLYRDCRCITELRTAITRYTRTEAHDLVKASPGALYVEAAGSRANVVPATREDLKYVRTAPSDTTADNLLNVREC